MKHTRRNRPVETIAVLIWTAAMLIAACAPIAPSTTSPSLSSVPSQTPQLRPTVLNLSTTIDVPPFPYATPLPAAVASPIDGLYSRTVPFEGTPVPCRRCAEYRIEGGVWTLFLDKGTFKVFHPGTGFAGVGSFTVSGERLALFNDPNCNEDLTMLGSYTWALEGNALTLKVIDDSCAIGLRAKNLALSPWTRVEGKGNRDPCQPPTMEAAITDHWPKPPGCP